MAKTACRLCGKCNKYYDISVSKCSCGESLMRKKYELIDLSSLREEAAERVGEINPELVFYQKKCPHCGRINYSVSENDRSAVCVYCNNPGIRYGKAVRYEEEEVIPAEEKNQWGKCRENILEELNSNTGNTGADKSKDNITETENTVAADAVAEETEPGKTESEKTESEKIESEKSESEKDITVNAAAEETTSDEFDVSSSWELFSDTIVFTAFLHGNVTFEISPEEGKKQVLLGRGAAQAELLSQDGYTSNEHCYIIFRDNSWYVRNNNPRNGTFLNNTLLQPTEERKLEENDLLKLGHHVNSMQFKIGFK